MGRNRESRRKIFAAVTETLEPRTLLSAYTQNIIASFTGGADGGNPMGTMVMDASGNLFGTASSGGSASSGSVFEVAKGAHAITPIASFDGAASGETPVGALIIDGNGNLFGTTEGSTPFADVPGTIFEVVKGSNAITTLATLSGNQGQNFKGGLLLDPASGNLFATTNAGGTGGMGTVVELTQGSHTLTTLASFDGTNGASPFGSLVFDGSGNLVGTTSAGGADGDGTIFQVAIGTGTVTTLATFDGSNGAEPVAGLVRDTNGNYFGTTFHGGNSDDGTIFELPANSSTITSLVSFNVTNGQNPLAEPTLDSHGNLFGTTEYGPNSSASSGGTMFELAAGASAVTQLTTFVGVNAPKYPYGGVVLDGSGDIFTTVEGSGANSRGAVIELTPAGGGGGGIGSLSVAISGKVPTSVVAGQKTTLSQVVAITDATASEVSGVLTTKLYLDTSSTLDSNAILLKSIPKSVKLKAHKRITVPFKLSSLPSTVPNGVYFVIAAVTDPTGAVTTAASTGSITVAAAHIDLSGAGIVAPHAKSGTKTQVTFTLSNAGNVAATGSLPITIETSPDANTANATLLTTTSKKINVKPGKPIKVTLPLSLPAGTYALVIVLDPNNTRNDSNPANNTFVSSILTVS
jgi:uncharacterized repeat protein (TIGR03803 family)